MSGLAERTRQGRACLVEIHRFNFLDRRESSLAALRDAIGESLKAFPELRFATPFELAAASIRSRDPAFLQFGLRGRLRLHGQDV